MIASLADAARAAVFLVGCFTIGVLIALVIYSRVQPPRTEPPPMLGLLLFVGSYVLFLVGSMIDVYSRIGHGALTWRTYVFGSAGLMASVSVLIFGADSLRIWRAKRTQRRK